MHWSLHEAKQSYGFLFLFFFIFTYGYRFSRGGLQMEKLKTNNLFIQTGRQKLNERMEMRRRLIYFQSTATSVQESSPKDLEYGNQIMQSCLTEQISKGNHFHSVETQFIRESWPLMQLDPW